MFLYARQCITIVSFGSEVTETYIDFFTPPRSQPEYSGGLRRGLAGNFGLGAPLMAWNSRWASRDRAGY